MVEAIRSNIELDREFALKNLGANIHENLRKRLVAIVVAHSLTYRRIFFYP